MPQAARGLLLGSAYREDSMSHSRHKRANSTICEASGSTMYPLDASSSLRAHRCGCGFISRALAPCAVLTSRGQSSLI